MNLPNNLKYVKNISNYLTNLDQYSMSKIKENPSGSTTYRYKHNTDNYKTLSITDFLGCYYIIYKDHNRRHNVSGPATIVVLDGNVSEANYYIQGHLLSSIDFNILIDNFKYGDIINTIYNCNDKLTLKAYKYTAQDLNLPNIVDIVDNCLIALKLEG